MSEKRKAPLGTLLVQVTTRTGAHKERGVPYIGLENIPSGGSKIGSWGRAEDSISSNTIFESGDILFGKLRPRLRKSVRAQFRGYCSTDVLVLRVAEDVHPGFAGYVAQSDTVFSAAIRTEEGTKMPRCSWKDIKLVEVFCPVDNKEQAKIASVLASLDLVIEKTEALIEKYQQIKAGLMHDLFTRGVLPDGKLRPTREQAPELYRETGIGWIPKEWTVRRNADLCQRICVGIVIQPTQYYVEDGIPAFRSANIREHGIDKSNFVFISSAANNLLIKSQVRAGDIISVRTGYPGTSAVVPLEFDGANCIDILIATPGGEVSSDYLCAWINSSFGKGQVFRQQGGMAQQHFNVGEMKELMVAFPDVDEQVRIEKILNNFSAKLKKESDFLNKIHFQKKGLMHDLLTGNVAVKVDEAQEEHV